MTGPKDLLQVAKGLSKSASPPASELELELFGRNAQADLINQTNHRTLARISEFRKEARKTRQSPGHGLLRRTDYPYFGAVPCRACGLEFAMFQANDDIVALHYLWDGDDGYETEMVRRWVAWCVDGGEVWDIGAYSGLMSILAGKASLKTKIHLFEPVEATFERATINLKLNRLLRRVTRHQLAASDSDGEVRINVFRSDGIVPTGSSLEAHGNRKVHFTKPIRTAQLDTYMPNAKPSVVKIDVEGHELACLRGMRDTLSRARPRILIEVWKDTRYATLSFLSELGYGLERVEARDQHVNNYFATPNQ